NLRDHIDDVRRNRKLNRLLQDVELPVAPADLAVAPIDADAVRDIFARLEFRTLMPRVFDAMGAGEVEDPADAVEIPAAVELSAAELATWAAAQDAEVAVTLTL